MPPATWDPATYLRYGDERSRPFLDLLSRVDVDAGRIVDLGCGPGHLTAVLRARWPEADIEGIDSSTQMIARARADDTNARSRYTEADLLQWLPDGPVDLLVSNATLQWVPGHLEQLPRLADLVAPAGAFAFSVPGNFDAPSHVLLDEVAALPAYAAHTEGRERASAHDPQIYLDALARPGWRVDAWESTYFHVLSGADPVFEWISGTGARPVLQALPDDLRERFVADFKAQLRLAYPPRAYGTVLPFRRVLVVATRTGDAP
ncbi:MAG: methyltransferase domain-containing protein [Nocardioidaceae bacterium]